MRRYRQYAVPAGQLTAQRLALAKERIRSLAEDNDAPGGFHDFFCGLACWLTELAQLYDLLEEADPETAAAGEGRELHRQAFFPEFPDDFGIPQLRMLLEEMQRLPSFVIRGDEESFTDGLELFLVFYSEFEENVPRMTTLRDDIYWYISDYAQDGISARIREMTDPEASYLGRMLEREDLTSTGWLWQLDGPVSAEMEGTASRQSALPEDILRSRADAFTESWIRGAGRALQTGGRVLICAEAGQGRSVKAVADSFAERGLRALVCSGPVRRTDFLFGRAGLLYPGPLRTDSGLLRDKALAQRFLETCRAAFEKEEENIRRLCGLAVLCPDAVRKDLLQDGEQGSVRSEIRQLWNMYRSDEEFFINEQHLAGGLL